MTRQKDFIQEPALELLQQSGVELGEPDWGLIQQSFACYHLRMHATRIGIDYFLVEFRNEQRPGASMGHNFCPKIQALNHE